MIRHLHAALALAATLAMPLACQPPESGPPSTHTSIHFFKGEKTTLPPLPFLQDTLIKTSHFQFIAHGTINAEAVNNLAECAETAFQNILQFTGHRGNIEPMAYHLYESSEQKGLSVQNTTLVHVDFEKNEVHGTLDECYKNNFTGKENEWLLRKILGRPKLDMLEQGLAIHFTHRWQEKGYEYWAAKLSLSSNLLSLSELLEAYPDEAGVSLQTACLSAALIDFLINKWGAKTLLEKYLTWQPSFRELETLEPEWQQYMAEKSHFFAHTFEQERLTASTPLPYLKGFNFAHEGYQIFNGYGSRMAVQALETLKNWGANAITIVPYSFMRDPRKPSPLPIMHRAGSETDESVIHSAEKARKLGMFVMLKPQLWLGRGSWTGDIDMLTEEEWQAFFKHYTRWMVHYAMLAELYHWEALCIGTELVQTTLKREDDWRELIRKIRGIYNGKITYAANWGDEFEKTGLWEELDFIGLNCYYPLSMKDTPSDRELRKGFERVLNKIEKVCRRYHKPLVFTEIGFPSVEAPWAKPHDDRGEVKADFIAQKRCYEVIFHGIAGKPWCSGILWWKFPSHLEKRRRNDTDFSPYGKPAEQVVQLWFSGEKLTKRENR